jgi:hypothetical protein
VIVCGGVLTAGCKPEPPKGPTSVEDPAPKGPKVVETWEWNGVRMRMSTEVARNVLGKWCGDRRLDEGDRAQARPPDPLTKYLRCPKSGVQVVDCPVDVEIRIYDGKVAELMATCSFHGNEDALRAWKYKVVQALDLRFGARHLNKVLRADGLYWRTDESLDVALLELDAEPAVPVTGTNLKPQRILLKYADVRAVELRNAEAARLERVEVEAASKKL